MNIKLSQMSLICYNCHTLVECLHYETRSKGKERSITSCCTDVLPAGESNMRLWSHHDGGFYEGDHRDGNMLPVPPTLYWQRKSNGYCWSRGAIQESCSRRNSKESKEDRRRKVVKQGEARTAMALRVFLCKNSYTYHGNSRFNKI